MEINPLQTEVSTGINEPRRVAVIVTEPHTFTFEGTIAIYSVGSAHESINFVAKNGNVVDDKGRHINVREKLEEYDLPAEAIENTLDEINEQITELNESKKAS